jgi:hypothetical protein
MFFENTFTSDEVFDALKFPVIDDPWKRPAVHVPQPRPDFADDVELQKAFGIALAKAPDAFKAGLELFPDHTSKALWASVYWPKEPIVIAACDAYKKTMKAFDKPLDKEELLAEVLVSARASIEDKDRATFLKLYAEIAGYTGKVAEGININTNNINNNVMTIKLVKAENKPAQSPQTINQAPNLNNKSQILNESPSPITLKLVGGVSR